MSNLSMYSMRKVLKFISVMVAIIGFIFIVSVDTEADTWMRYALIGFGIFLLGSILTIIFTDPVSFIGLIIMIGITFNYMLYRTFNRRTSTSRKCYKLLKKHNYSLYHAYESICDALYDMDGTNCIS